VEAQAQVAGDAAENLQGLIDQAADAAQSDSVGLNARVIQLFLVVTVLSLAPGIAMMITCLPFMIIVFSFLRQAIGLQQSPPVSNFYGIARAARNNRAFGSDNARAKL